MGSEMGKIEQKKQATTLTDHQIMKLDEEIRESKSDMHYEPKKPDSTITAINNLTEVVGGVYSELKELNHLFREYLYTDRRYEENEK